MRGGLLVGFLLLLPAAHGAELVLEGPNAVIAPDVGMATMAAQLTFTCEELITMTTPADTQVTVSYTFSKHPEVLMAGPLEDTVSAAGCYTTPTGSLTSTLNYNLTASRFAPGVMPLPLEAQITATGQLGAGTEANATTTMEVGFHGATIMRIAEPLRQVEPGEVTSYAIELENTGNAATAYTFTVVEDGGATIALPNGIVAGVETGSNRVTASVDVTAPSRDGWNNNAAAIVIEITSAAADDSTQSGETLTASLLLRTQGFGGEVGTPGPSAALLFVGLAALAARRRNR